MYFKLIKSYSSGIINKTINIIIIMITNKRV